MGKPHNDILCRGCQSRPSYKNISTYLCAKCWDQWNLVRRKSERLEDGEIPQFKADLTEFIRKRGRYVFQQEVYIYFKPVSEKQLKHYGIKVATLCRELGYFAPADDRFTKETIARVRDFVTAFAAEHGTTPTVREIIAGAGIDHTTLWSIDYEKIVRDVGGRVRSDVRFRFRSAEEFKRAAVQIVKDAGCPLHMTMIMEELGISYPGYLENFASVTPDEILTEAGFGRLEPGQASIWEAIAEKALRDLGYEVERQVSFEGLVGDSGRLLCFDIRVVGLNVLVEIDGPHHYDPRDRAHKKSTIIYDRRKDRFARKNGFRLIRVDLRVIDRLDKMRAYFKEHIGEGPIDGGARGLSPRPPLPRHPNPSGGGRRRKITRPGTPSRYRP